MWPIWVGLRYTKAKRRNHFISFITFSSVLGITIGVLALIVVLSVMNGFQKELQERILSMTAHLTLSDYNGHLENWKEAEQDIDKHKNVLATAPYILREGMLSLNGYVKGALVRGVLPEKEKDISKVSEHMLEGRLENLQAREYGIILGQYLANEIGARVGYKVTLLTPSANVSLVGVAPRMKRFTVVGIFNVGMNEYDNSLALIHIKDAAKLYKMRTAVTGLRIQLENLYQAPRVVRELNKHLGYQYHFRSWTDEHVNLFRAVKIEKTMMFIILSLIVAVAAFNIVSTLVFVVNDKESNIAILRTLGATPPKIMQIFIIQGMVIGGLGTCLGIALGVPLAMNLDVIIPLIEQAFDVQFLNSDVYLISDLPSELKGHDVLMITILSFSLTVLATLYPAWRASQVQPAEALRYE